MALCLAASATAQDGISRADLSEVRKTDREQLHPGEALKIRGIAQGANDFLANTPALRSGPSAVQLVEAKDAHARRLAMYDDGKHFTEPPRQSRQVSADGVPLPLEHSESPETSKTPKDEDEPSDGSNKYLLPGMLIGLVLYTIKKLTS